jgi:hypothetical protein
MNTRTYRKSERAKRMSRQWTKVLLFTFSRGQMGSNRQPPRRFCQLNYCPRDGLTPLFLSGQPRFQPKTTEVVGSGGHSPAGGDDGMSQNPAVLSAAHKAPAAGLS